MTDLIQRLRERAESYRLSGPSSEHTAALLDEAANEIYVLRGQKEPDQTIGEALEIIWDRRLANPTPAAKLGGDAE